MVCLMPRALATSLGLLLSVTACQPATTPRRADPAALRCAPTVNDPAWLYGAGEASSADAEKAKAAARDRAIAQLAVGLCTTVRSDAVARGSSTDGARTQAVEERVEVSAVMEGVEGIEEVEREARPTPEGAEACVIVRLARPALEEKATKDRARLLRSQTVAAEADQRCGTPALRAIEEATASLAGLCPGLQAEATSLAEVSAALRLAQQRAEARAREEQARVAVGVTCAEARGPMACAEGLRRAALERLTALGVSTGSKEISGEEARAMVENPARPPVEARCEGRRAVLELVLRGEASRKLKTATEHTATIAARWIVVEGDAKVGEVSSASGGAYARDEARLDAAKKAIASAGWPASR